MAGRPPNAIAPKKMLKTALPINEIFVEDEVELYNKLVDVYLEDFDSEDLTSSDMDDVLDLAKNRVNPNEMKGFSIVDLAVAFTNEKRLKLKEKADKLKIEEQKIIESRKDYFGNKNDIDIKENKDSE
jgi:hypothetical protein